MLGYGAPYIDQDLVLPLLFAASIGYIGAAAAVVLLVKTIANKLMLVGLLTFVAAVAFGAIVPGTLKIAIIMAVCASMCVVSAIVTAIVAWLVDLLRNPKPDSRS